VPIGDGAVAPDVDDGSGRAQESIAELWGNLGLNRVIDGAGRHRRLAAGCGLLTIPFLVMGAATTTVYADRVASFGLFLAAGSFLWLASDLIRTGRLVGSNRFPHASVAALGIGFWMIHHHHSDQLDDLFESEPLLTPGLALFAAAVGTLTLEDRTSTTGPSARFVGRTLLVCSAFMVGYSAVAATFTNSMAPAYALGIGSAGAMLIAMATFEGKLLWRGIALALSISSK
jgi:hypothetical protein